MIYNYNWGVGIIVEQFRGSPPGGHHQSLESASSAACAYRHHARKRRVRASNVPPRFSGNTQLNGWSPNGIPMTPPAIPPGESFPRNVAPLQNGHSNVTTHAQDMTVHPSLYVRQTVPYPPNPLYSPITPDHQQAPLRKSSLSSAIPSNSRWRESTSGAHHGHRRTTPTTTTTIQGDHPYSHLNAPPHTIHVPTAEPTEIQQPTHNPSTFAPPHMIHVPTAELTEIQRPAHSPSASHGAAMPPWAMPLP